MNGITTHKSKNRFTRDRLRNWGDVFGGRMSDPALVPYYVKQPWTIDKRMPSRAVDHQEAERAERVILRVWKRDKDLFKLLRAYYAYNVPVVNLAERARVSVSTIGRRRDHAEELFGECWHEIYG